MTNNTNNGELFCLLSSRKIAVLIRTAEGVVCYAGPGIQQEPAKAIAMARTDDVDWDKACREFRGAVESSNGG